MICFLMVSKSNLLQMHAHIGALQNQFKSSCFPPMFCMDFTWRPSLSFYYMRIHCAFRFVVFKRRELVPLLFLLVSCICFKVGSVLF